MGFNMSTKKERMYQAIEKHGANLNSIFNTAFDNVTLCKRLHSLEVKLHKFAEDYCNGVMTEENYDIEENVIAKKVAKILGRKVSTADGVPTYPLYFNRDPRGYSLKLDDEYVRDNNLDIHKDWGGYGILAPDFSETK
jgi:hypothetical protein